MVLGVLIVACCVVFAVWRTVKPRSASPLVYSEKLLSDLSLSCIALALWSWFKPRSVKSPPMYPGCLPLIGHGYQLMGDERRVPNTYNTLTSYHCRTTRDEKVGIRKDFWKREKQVVDFCLQNNDLIEMRLGFHSLFVLTDPEDSLTVANNCLEKPYIYHYADNVYVRGLLTTKVDIWKTHRKLLNPAFNPHVLQSFVGEYCRQAKRLVSSLASEAGNGPFDIQPYLVPNVLTTAYRTTFGTKVDENSETLKIYEEATDKILMLILERTKYIWLHLPFIYKLTTSGREFDKRAKILKDITESVIANRKLQLKAANQLDKLEESTTEGLVPLLDRMLDLADKQNVFNDDDIKEHLDTIVGAAYDTTATALTFILILIGSHPDIQEKMYQELQEVLEDEERDINKHDLPKLVYMEAVIKETLRLYPPAPRFARTSNIDVKLKNYTLPANSIYIVSLYGLHRHAMWGPDKDQFIPERWLDPARLPKNPNFFAAFCLGRRNCIGRLYGIMAIKTTLSYLLRHYRILSDIEKLELQCNVLIRPVSGHFISLESRV